MRASWYRNVVAASSLLFMCAIGSMAQATELKLVTESYPPFNFRDGETYKGASIDQIRLIMDKAAISYSIEMMPWARAYALALNERDYCIFTTVHNDERDRKFKWVEPLQKSRTMLIRKAGAKVDPKTLEAAKAFVIGTQRDDFTQTLLESNHFPKIDLATDLNLTLTKLMNGRIDLMPVAESYYDTLHREGVNVEPVLTLAESVYALACNPAVPDATIKTLQSKLDEIIANGEQKKLFEKYGLIRP